MHDIYDQFLDKALQGRKKAGKDMTRENLEKLAGGRIWTGRQAKEDGLVDELGTLDDAIACGRRAGRDSGWDGRGNPPVAQAPSPAGVAVRIPVRHRNAFRSGNLLPELASKIRGVDSLLPLNGEPVWVVLPYHLEMR